MSGLLNLELNGSSSNLPDTVGRPSGSSFFVQSASLILYIITSVSRASSHGHSSVTNKGRLGVAPISGNTGPQITSLMGNIVGAGNMARSLSSGGGLFIPGLASRLNLTGNCGSGSLSVLGLNRLMGGMLPKDYSLDLPQKELNDSARSMMLSQHFPMGRSSGFSLGGFYSFHRRHQQQ
ncbi:hypothetical protein NE237_029637 [Protea cynaroides]|uniref:Uncharacterized protein n=1 Tax=Protea cynaroides TaxID=273540 RepID=A0A9Q0JW93_9MAGN|nr:hypothetical protein NE237_029637 [Protea cynaroides]